jgi:hypothetical protein
MFFLMGLQKASQGSPLHVVNYTSVYNGEIWVGNGDGVIQFKVGYNELVDKDLGEDEFYKLKNKHVMKSCLWNLSATKIFVSLGIEQQVHGHFLKLMTILLL